MSLAPGRASGKRCRFVDRHGKLTKARKCSQPLFLKAKGTSNWSLSLARKLPKGTYKIQARAVDAAGNLGVAAKKTQRVR